MHASAFRAWLVVRLGMIAQSYWIRTRVAADVHEQQGLGLDSSELDRCFGSAVIFAPEARNPKPPSCARCPTLEARNKRQGVQQQEIEMLASTPRRVLDKIQSQRCIAGADFPLSVRIIKVPSAFVFPPHRRSSLRLAGVHIAH